MVLHCNKMVEPICGLSLHIGRKTFYFLNTHVRIACEIRPNVLLFALTNVHHTLEATCMYIVEIERPEFFCVYIPLTFDFLQHFLWDSNADQKQSEKPHHKLSFKKTKICGRHDESQTKCIY